MTAVKRVIYNEPQDIFFRDVTTNAFISKMVSTSLLYNLRAGYHEQISWVNNAPKIKELLVKSNVKGTYVTFEYLVPYNMKRIDCMIYGKDGDGNNNVVHIELKQWSNNTVKPTTIEGNFDTADDDMKDEVIALTGGGYRRVAHPSLQVQGYNDYLTGFIEVIGTNVIGLRGLAYCYNYIRHPKSKNVSTVLYAPEYNDIQSKFRCYSKDELDDLAKELHNVLCCGDGLSIFNKMMNSPIRPSKKVLEAAANMIDAGNVKEFALIDDQITAKMTILDKIKKMSSHRKSIVLVKGGPGTGKTVIALNLLAELAASKKNLSIHYATKSKPLLEALKNKMPRGSQAKLLFSNVTKMIPAYCDENQLDVLLVDEAHRITKSPNSQYTKAENRTDLSMIDTLVRAAKVGVFFIDDKQAIRSLEIGTSDMITDCARRYNADIVEVELKSQFRCNGSDNYLDWIEQMLYSKKVTSVFTPDEFDFRIFDDPQQLYDTIAEKDSLANTSARLTAGFCWKWSSNLDTDGSLVKDVKIGNFEMPWETKDTIKSIPAGYVKWYEWAYKPEGIKQVGCIYTAQGFEFDYIGVIIGADLKYDKEKQCVVSDINANADPVLHRGQEQFDIYVRNIYRVLMSRGMKGCYVYICDSALKDYFVSKLRQMTEKVEIKEFA